MAENEILDVGNRRYFRRWRTALADANLTPSEVAECLYNDFSKVLRTKLRGKQPLYLVLKACGSDREARQEVIANYKDRAMANLVEQAYVLTRNNDPLIVAQKMTQLLIDRLVGRTNLYALKHHNADGVRHAALDRATVLRLEACRPEITGLLVASLRNEKIPRAPNSSAIRTKMRTSVESLLSGSLLRAENKPTDRLPRV